MKLFHSVPLLLGLGVALSAGAATTVKMPDSQICKSKMQANFYPVFDGKVDAAVA